MPICAALGAASLARLFGFGVGFVVMQRLGVVLVAIVAVGALGMPAALATWSVAAVEEETGEVGVAVASCVGFEVSVVPVLVPSVGAAASQAAISEMSGARLVESLEGGASASEAVEAVVALDEAPDDRQFGVVVLGGGGDGWTGSDTFDVALDRRGAGERVSVQGNILVSEDVVTGALAAFDDSRCGDQTATSAALIVARPGDASYANTDVGLVGVDPASDEVPSVYVSVLVETGGERAPDRLAAAWAGADRSLSQVVIQQVDAGADTSAEGARRFVRGFLLIVVSLIVGAVVLVILRRRRRSSPR